MKNLIKKILKEEFHSDSDWEFMYDGVTIVDMLNNIFEGTQFNVTLLNRTFEDDEDEDILEVIRIRNNNHDLCTLPHLNNEISMGDVDEILNSIIYYLESLVHVYSEIDMLSPNSFVVPLTQVISLIKNYMGNVGE